MVRKKLILACTLTVCAIAIAAGVMFYLSTKGDKLDLETNATLGMLPGIDQEQRLKELQTQLDKSMIAFSVNTSPVFNGNGEGDLMIENPANNAKLLKAEVVLMEGEQLLYQSKALMPGSYLDGIQLDKVPQPGTYDAVVYLKAYSEDTHEYIGQTGAQIKLTVEP